MYKINIKTKTLVIVTLAPCTVLVTLLTAWLVYQDMATLIEKGFTSKLTAISTVTSSFIDGGEMQRILVQKDEQSPLYLKYVEPMQRIRDKLGITYLYTQIPANREDVDSTQSGSLPIVYVLDASLGENHTAIGYRDTLRENKAAQVNKPAGARSVILEAEVYCSEIGWEKEWGLLKVAYAPIYGEGGRVTAMAGADIDVVIIGKKTRKALYQIGLAGLFLLVLSSFAAVLISNKLTRPIERLKAAALQIAAGQYDYPLQIKNPSELQTISRSVDQLRAVLEDEVGQLDARNLGLVGRRREQALLTALAGPSSSQQQQRPKSLSCGWLGVRPVCRDSSGWICSSSAAIAWLAEAPPDLFAALRLRAETTAITRHLSQIYMMDWNESSKALADLMSDAIYGWIFVDSESESVEWLCSRPLSAVVTSAGAMRRVELSGKGSIKLDRGETLYVTSTDATHIEDALKVEETTDRKHFTFIRTREHLEGLLLVVEEVESGEFEL